MTQQPGQGWGGPQGAGGYGPPPQQPPKKPKRWPWIAGGVVLLLIVVGAMGGRGGDSTSTAAPATSTTTAAAAPTTTTAAPTTTTSVLPSVTVPPAAPATSAEPVRASMPDVVCMNLQAAQDLIQTLGIFVSLSEDGTGAGRQQVLDRNWVVTAQRPAPGELFGEGEAVLTAVKIGEPSPC
ncbi:hypothetical protein [Rhodococcus aerolatus]